MYTNILISDFTLPEFQSAFKTYFQELGITVSNWDGLFAEMNSSQNTWAFLRFSKDKELIGFLMFTYSELSDWFFSESVSFLREFWIAPARRSQGHGTALLSLAESKFLQDGIFKAILTTDTASQFYLRQGYVPAPHIRAKNKMDVYVKELG